MALLLRYEKFDTGETYQSAYHRVMAVNINTVKGAAEVVVGIYKDEAARRDGKKPVQTGTCAATGGDAKDLFSEAVLAADGATPVRAAYTLLKRQAMYSGAQDV